MNKEEEDYEEDWEDDYEVEYEEEDWYTKLDHDIITLKKNKYFFSLLINKNKVLSPIYFLRAPYNLNLL